MSYVTATPDLARAIAAHNGTNRLGVALFHRGKPALPGLGGSLHASARQALPGSPSQTSWDFLAFAMAAFGADRFVSRASSDDGWTRLIAINVGVSNPDLWNTQAPRLAAALRFLTGDIWHLTFEAGGSSAPDIPAKRHDRDTVSLFSGGLDSLLGAIFLLNEQRSPFLVSQGSMKEVGPQLGLATAIGLQSHRFDGRVREKWRQPYEGSTRGRSLIFFAYGVVAASAHALPEVIVPENGLIAINPPFTARRKGSLSTRTTHPHFLSILEEVLAAVGEPVRIRNIFEHWTKGEMLSAIAHPNKTQLASASYSCGKGKRQNGQCGRCVPCLIRRASFAEAELDDGTRYFSTLEDEGSNDDVMAARLAVAKRRRLNDSEMARWVAQAGPLPVDPHRKAGIVRAVSAGLDELGRFLDGVAWRQ